MSSLPVYFYLVIFIINIITGTLIAQNIAKNNEWTSSYKIAFIIIFTWMTITLATSLIIQLIIGNLSFTGRQNVDSALIGIITLIVPLSTFLILGPVIIKMFYKTEFRESFSMAIRVLIYQSILQTFFFPLFLI
jgi:hypothetical protein